MTYHAGSHTIEQKSVILTETILESINQRNSEIETWRNVPVTVPDVASSILLFCNIINISYQIQVGYMLVEL